MITFKNKSGKPEEIKFKSLSVTDTFLVDGYPDNEIFIRVETSRNVNSISLKGGSLHDFSDWVIVKPVDLVIEYSVRN